ncbi:hypothetical protein [Endozoicomonas sp. ALD040]|uniref:hypothetical protein n=1 Tax=Endozoicomonas sp. ALD040 TaxID=3403079 RepID=UPI003BAE5F85
MAEEIKEAASELNSRLVLINEQELNKLRQARQLLLRRVEAEQESEPEVRLKKLAINRLDTLAWCKQELV